MNLIPITGKIDVDKMDQNKLFKGAKGTYLDIVLIPTPNGQYGDYMIVQSVSKEERLAGVKGAILGNAKNVGQGQPQEQSAPARQMPVPARRGEEDDDSPPF